MQSRLSLGPVQKVEFIFIFKALFWTACQICLLMHNPGHGAAHAATQVIELTQFVIWDRYKISAPGHNTIWVSHKGPSIWSLKACVNGWLLISTQHLFCVSSSCLSVERSFHHPLAMLDGWCSKVIWWMHCWSKNPFVTLLKYFSWQI